MGRQISEEEQKRTIKKFEHIQKILKMLMDFAELNKIYPGDFRGAIALYICTDFMGEGEDLDQLQYFMKDTWTIVSELQGLSEKMK